LPIARLGYAGFHGCDFPRCVQSPPPSVRSLRGGRKQGSRGASTEGRPAPGHGIRAPTTCCAATS
jgi:hypothetical protein